jgi:3'-5' exoribonuclease
MVKSKRMSSTRQGKPFLDLTLQDKTGTIEAKVWDDAEAHDGKFVRGDVIKIKAEVDEWQGRMQLKIKQLRRAAENDDVDMEALIPSSDQDPEAMKNYLRRMIENMENPFLQGLLKVMFEDQKFMALFTEGAGARDLHHAYRGGLLEHTVNMLKIAQFLLDEIFPGLDRSLVLTGVMLHDVGKVMELDSQKEISYTREGYLLGHIYMGSRIIEQYARQVPDFPEDALTRLQHIILSHHGEREWGAVVLPMTPEAMLIHQIDNLEAKTHMVLKAIDQDPHTNEEFTAYHKTLKRHFFKGPFVGATRPCLTDEPESED